jgi:prophage regulatory protein
MPSRRKEKIAEAQAMLGDGPRLLCRAEVCAMTSLTYPSIWKKMQDGEFPRSRQVAPGRVGWLYDEVVEWIRNLPIALLKGDAR